jgi:hypothetical protein
MMKYKVLHRFGSGWGDAGWLVDGEPMRFDTPAEARKEIADVVYETREAVWRGDMYSAYRAADYMVVDEDSRVLYSEEENDVRRAGN